MSRVGEKGESDDWGDLARFIKRENAEQRKFTEAPKTESTESAKNVAERFFKSRDVD